MRNYNSLIEKRGYFYKFCSVKCLKGIFVNLTCPSFLKSGSIKNWSEVPLIELMVRCFMTNRMDRQDRMNKTFGKKYKNLFYCFCMCARRQNHKSSLIKGYMHSAH